VRKAGVWISPVVERSSVARCLTSSGQSRSRWCEELRSSPHRHGSAVMLGGESVGERLQKTLHIARVSAQSTPCRFVGNLKDGLDRGSSFFQRARNSARTCVSSQVFVVSANWQGVFEDAPSLASVSALSLPRMLQCEGHHIVKIFQPRSCRVTMISIDRHTYSWLCLLNLSVSIAA